jgi:hypothetical protein
MNDKAVELLRECRARIASAPERKGDMYLFGQIDALLAQSNVAPQVPVTEAGATQDASTRPQGESAKLPASAAREGMSDEQIVNDPAQLDSLFNACMFKQMCIRHRDALSLREREGMVRVPRESTLTITNISYALAKELVDDHWGSVYWNKEGSCYPENEMVVTYTSAAPSAGGEKP